jgi:hypothetical protein
MRTLRHHHRIQQFRVDDAQGIEMWNLAQFARECGTEIAADFPIFLVFVDGELVAYYYAYPSVSIWPTVHPDRLSPRAFYEVGKTIVAASKCAFGNPLWLIDSESKLSAPEILSKVGLYKPPLSVYRVI